MSLSRLWWFLAIALPVLAALLASMSTVDLTYHLRAGADILATGTIPTTDAWTFTVAGASWFDQQWGAQVVLHVVERLGSWTGLALLRTLATGIVVGCLALIAHRAGVPPRRAALLVLAAFAVAAPAMALRPQLFGMAAFAILLVLVTERHRHPRMLWLAPLVVAIWANLHGSFFLGPLVLGLAWLADLHDRSPNRHLALAVAVAGVIAACVNPAGPGVWWYAAGLSADPDVTARVTEWQPTSMREPVGLLFFGSVFGIVVLIARRGARVPWPSLVWLGVFFLIGIYAQRGVAWWPLAIVPVVAPWLVAVPGASAATTPSTMRRLNAVVAAVLIVSGVALLPAWRPTDPGTGVPAGLLTDAPPGVTRVLREIAQPGDRILNPQPWGSWLIFVVPDATVAIDSRIELFPGETWAAYEGVMAGVDGWQDQVAAWGVTIVVLEPDQTATRDRFLSDGWSTVLGSDDGIVLGRS